MTNRQFVTMRAQDISLQLRTAPTADAPSLTRAEKAYIASDIEALPPAQRTVCPSCASSLRHPQRQSVSCAATSAECLLCAVAAGKPEAFTKPFCEFLSRNPTVWHAVEYSEKKLRDAGFKPVRRQDSIPLRVHEAGVGLILTQSACSSPPATSGSAKSPPAESTT